MSEKETMEEKTQIPSDVDLIAQSTKADQPNKINDDESNSNGSSIEECDLKHLCSEKSIAVGNQMDLVEPTRSEELPVEMHQNPCAEIDAVNHKVSPIELDQKQTHIDHEATTIADTVICNNSVCINMSPINQSADINVEAKQSITKTNVPVGVGVKVAKQQQPHPVTPSIGSLSLLNQYDSSSDEDESSSDSSSSSSGESDGSEDSDSESESDDNDSNIASSNNVETVPNAPGATEGNQLNALANTILNGVLSRNNYREVSSDTSETDSDDSDIECVGSISATPIDITNDDELQEILDACETATPSGPVKAKGEFTIDDLPPIEELTIIVPESECVELGKVSGIVGTLVLVESLPNFAAVDIDTVLFLDKGNRTLGQVFDVMGNVASPIYCVRFNTVQDITAKDIKAGLHVYVAPQSEYTNFIVISDLIKQKGCDGSWENDHEAPDGLEFSDDEEERLARRMHNQRQHNRNRTTSESSEHAPHKVVKNEPNTSQKSNNPTSRQPKSDHRMAKTNKPSNQFYKDNRGYANVNPEANLYQHQQFQHHHHRNRHHQQQQQQHYPQQQQMQSMHNNYSWHTAAMHGMPPPIPSQNPLPMPYAQQPYVSPANAATNSTLYPNPFALQANPLHFGPFNLQAFPPLPPPMSSLPPPLPSLSAHHQQPSTSGRFNRKNTNPYQHQQR